MFNRRISFWSAVFVVALKLMKDLGFSNDTSEPIEDRFVFTGRERPVDPNMEYKRARHFDPTTGRWMSQDPLAFDDGDDHKYPYAKPGN